LSCISTSLIRENQPVDNTNENLRSIFERVVVLPSRSAVTNDKPNNDTITYQTQNVRADETLTFYQK
jgi:hypothetical protein